MQTKKGSMFEVCCNVFSGIITSILTWKLIIEPWASMYTVDLNTLSLLGVFFMNSCFTLVSIIRGYGWRRLFNWLEYRGIVQ